LSRHGGRYPDAEDIQDMNEITSQFQDSILKNSNSWLCKSDLKLLKNWKTRIDQNEHDHILTTKGRQLMRDLGKRMNTRLLDLIPTLRENQIKIQTTSMIRTQQSADEYLNGLLNYTTYRPGFDIIGGEEGEEDFLLKCPDNCPKYQDLIEKKSNYCPELKDFEENAPQYKTVLKTFAKRVGTDLTGKKLSKFRLSKFRFKFLLFSKFISIF
jgi:hypothetical protein